MADRQIIERVFVGEFAVAATPARAAANAILDRCARVAAAIDATPWLVIIPGERSGRLLMRAMIEAAAEMGLALDPPLLATPGSLIESLYAPLPDELAAATVFERRLAWMRAIDEADEAIRATLVPRAGGQVDLATARRWAGRVVTLEDDLAIADRSLADAVHATVARGGDATRLEALAALAPRADDLLAAAGLSAPHHLRRSRTNGGSPRFDRVALAGTLELAAPQRRALRGIKRLLSVVFASEAHGEEFDGIGCAQERSEREPDDIESIVSERSAMARSLERVLNDEQMVLAESDLDQAEAALRFLDEVADAGTPLACDAVAIGLGEASIGPLLSMAARDAGVEIHDAAGSPLLASRVGRVLCGLASWIRERTPEHFAALLRLPIIEAHLRGHLAAADLDGAAVVSAPLERFDAWCQAHRPAHLERALTGEEGPAIRSLVAAMDALVAPIDEQGVRGILAPLAWESEDAPALLGVTSIVEEIEAIPPSLGQLDGAWALAAVLERAATERVPIEPRERSVEALGWLELLFEPAPNMVILGMNEGSIPSGGSGDGLLPESVRAALGIPTRRSRAVRDRAILRSLARRCQRVRLVVGRIDAEGAPRAPSRLLLEGRGADLARRVAMLSDHRNALRGERWWREGRGGTNAFFVPEPPREASEIPSMSVTGFRAYLACGTRFWLSHIERLREVEVDLSEVPLPDLGTVVHEVLGSLAAAGALSDTDEGRLASALRSAFLARTRELFGSNPLPGVRLQVQAFLPRLDAFAQWQARASLDGWEIRESEFPLPLSTVIAPREVTAMQVVGRVDRIDFHPARRVWRVIDFKTSEQGKHPRAAHLSGTNRNRRWIDLQLPLYAHGLRSELLEREPESLIELGFVRLPANPERSGWVNAEFTDEELEDALHCAASIVTEIRRGHFPLGVPMGDHDPCAAILQIPVFGGAADSDEEEES